MIQNKNIYIGLSGVMGHIHVNFKQSTQFHSGVYGPSSLYRATFSVSLLFTTEFWLSGRMWINYLPDNVSLVA